ncbi:unnamed protein product [Aphanomyces euteiches]
MAHKTDDVVQDLHLLFATDDQLHKDLAYICSLLESPERPTKTKREKPTTTSQEFAHMDRRKRQILQLRRQVDTLKDTLLQAQQIVTGKPDMSTWERAAREQMLAYSKSLSENEKLRAHVEENATFIEEMVSTFRKKPRLSTLEKVDPYTVYQSFRNLDRDDQVHANNVFKYYVEVNREVIVWRSVLEDALMPRMRDDVVQNKWGWLVLAPTDSPETSRLTFLHQVEPTELYAEIIQPEFSEVKKSLNEKYTFGVPPEIPGTFPGGNVKEEIEFPVVPLKKSFFDRDMELERTLKHVIDNVVFEYHKMSPSRE